MNENKYIIPNAMTPCEVLTFDSEICVGCNTCVNVCRTDVLMPNPEKGKEPVIVYPDECWFCGSCVEECPNPGAITMHHPLNQKMAWKRKDTGEIFRIVD